MNFKKGRKYLTLLTFGGPRHNSRRCCGKPDAF